jgi:hypothetical protein
LWLGRLSITTISPWRLILRNTKSPVVGQRGGDDGHG